MPSLTETNAGSVINHGCKLGTKESSSSEKCQDYFWESAPSEGNELRDPLLMHLVQRVRVFVLFLLYL